MAYDLTPLDASIQTFEYLSYALTASLFDEQIATDLNHYAKMAGKGTDPLLAAATLMAAYLRAAVADLDARTTTVETQAANHESRLLALETAVFKKITVSQMLFIEAP